MIQELQRQREQDADVAESDRQITHQRIRLVLLTLDAIISIHSRRSKAASLQEPELQDVDEHRRAVARDG
jgi:hypothetical protein